MKKNESPNEIIKLKKPYKRFLGLFLAVCITVGSVPVYRSIKSNAAENGSENAAVETASASDAEKAETETTAASNSETEKNVSTISIPKSISINTSNQLTLLLSEKAIS